MRLFILAFGILTSLVSCSRSGEKTYHSYLMYDGKEIPLDDHSLFYNGRANNGDPHNPPYSYQYSFYEEELKPSFYADGAVYEYAKEGYVFHIALNSYNPLRPEAGRYNQKADPSLQAANRTGLLTAERIILPDSSDFFVQYQTPEVIINYDGSDLIFDLLEFNADLYRSDTIFARNARLSLHYEGTINATVIRRP